MLQSMAQEFLVVHPHTEEETSEVVPTSEVQFEVVEPNECCEELEIEENQEPLEVFLEFSGDLPGAVDSPEEHIEVHDEHLEVKEEEKKDENEARKSKKNEKWDWKSKGPSGFIVWIKERFDSVPKHSGYDSAGIERVISYLEKLDSEISQAMRLDLEGELDSNKIEEIRSKIEDGLDRSHDRLDKIKKSKKIRTKKSDLENDDIVKVAQKITGVDGVHVTVPLLISGIVRTCINGMVSGGHDIEKIYQDQVKKYKLDDREKAEVRWLLYDMGLPMRGDRGFMPEEDFDAASSDNFDYAANYQG